ncbi:MAG TPA: glycosyltransferase family 2 protein, partial [Parasegetibacter sp.]
MQVSVIIVNYNVQYFLEQCLYALTRAVKNIDAEIIVVDNCSTDNSLKWLPQKFPGVKFIASPENLGFAKANNLGLTYAAGEFILFLNPDTLVGENSIQSVIAAMQKDERIGAAGIKMLDGSGNFLKESKRAFPSPLTSLFKLSGLAALFPRSPLFARYYLGHLDDNTSHEVDVLAGAFMMVKRHVLEEVGSFDEQFFMYGE